MNGTSAAVELISMWVAPNARGMGVEDTQPPARHLYERNHFRFVDGIEDGDGEVRMVRRLA